MMKDEGGSQGAGSTKSVLVVCTANICRSAMGAALLRHRLARVGVGDDRVHVESAGVLAVEGQPATPLGISTLEGRGVEAGEHRSQPVDLPLLQRSDVVLVMEERHRTSVRNWDLRLLDRTYLLSELSGRHIDVPDPFGGGAADYDATATLLEQLIDAGMPRLLALLGESPSS